MDISIELGPTKLGTRRNFLVPAPCVESLEALNAEPLQRCDRDLDRTLQGKAGSNRELLAIQKTSSLFRLQAAVRIQFLLTIRRCTTESKP
ncbi:hypothetical protein I41_49240 [Lacipirellula limnantheis]|uniref:Uncharacterized protein n=1 Tax=Lacipirellula limnantheis TaxID=2528024 RepID=A0A517U4Z0_9BACT|nr:hypothetical protein I41_49240 [Lacipirellula limnantheis]